MKQTEPETIVFPEFYRVLSADLSLRRPAFCLLSVRKTENETKIKIRKLFSVDNKKDKKKTHGQLLDEIRIAFIQNLWPIEPNVFLVRENEIMHMMTPAERNLSKVVGLMDWLAWSTAQKEWYSIYPTTVKKLITGSGKAEKEDVANALEYYVGKQEYEFDDESDAVAVAVAWLIQQGQIKQKECP